MRCRYCGATSLHADKQHKTFSTGKAVAGAVVFGPTGAIAGMIDKDQDGYRCGACGAFMDAPMDLLTEHSIDSAISDAETGRDISKYQYYQKQYHNIHATIPAQSIYTTAQVSLPASGPALGQAEATEAVSTIKHMYRNLQWVKTCPVYVERIIIHTSNTGDTLSLEAWNQDKTAIRSVYFQVTVYDDTGDKIGECQCVYQGLSISPGQRLPIDKQFPLQTDLAYRVELVCEKIALLDDTVWRTGLDNSEVTLSVQPELEEMGFPRLKYVRLHIHEVSKLEDNAPLYLPVENNDYWQCICGQPVISNCTCPRCGASIKELNILLSQERLQEIQQKNVKAIAAKRAKATMALYEQVIQQETETQYQQAFALQYQDTEESLNQAAALYNSISSYKDSTQRAIDCQKRISVLKEELKVAQDKLREKEIALAKAEQEKQAAKIAVRKKMKRIVAVSAPVVILVIITVVAITQVIIPNNRYKAAERLLTSGDYDGAIEIFADLGDYKNSQAQVIEISYRQAVALMEAGEYNKAIESFRALDNYKDSKECILECEKLQIEAKQLENYETACDLLAQGEYADAMILFNQLGDFKDSTSQVLECENAMIRDDYNKAVQLYKDGDYFNAIDLLRNLGEYEDGVVLVEEIEKYMLSDSKVGDTIYFGSYDNKPISWRVLDIQNGSVLVRATESLFSAQYNFRKSNMVTWEISSLRKHLNGEFLETAFSKNEQSFIITTTLNNEWYTDKLHLDPTINIGGNNTDDQIFILSRDELFQYCDAKSGRFSFSFTSNAGYENGTSGSAWLRTPDVEMEDINVGIWVELALVVHSDGSFGHGKDGVLVTGYQDVVPAMRIDISSF